MAQKRKQQKMHQKQITEHALPVLKKPLEAIGKLVGFPGAYWKGRMTDQEKTQIYRCATKDFSLAYKFSPSGAPEAAYKMQEMGLTGTGSTEKGDASGEIFWVPVQTYLKYYYATFPDEMPKPAGEAAKPKESVDLTSDDATTKSDVVPEFPNLRLSRAEVMRYFTIKSDTLIEMGPKCGMYKAGFECIIQGSDGCYCGATREVPHKKAGGVSTSNLITHLRQAAVTCPKHKEALVAVEKANASVVMLDGGETVKLYNFSESFSHHIDFMYMRATGLFSQQLSQHEAFRGYIRSFDLKASFPHKTTIHKIAMVVHDLQGEERVARITRKMGAFRGKMCYGVQLDMWTCTDTHTAFGCISLTSVEEPSAGMVDPQLWRSSEILDFGVFPYTSKTGANIKAWFIERLDQNGLKHDAISGVTPDGAADGHCALGMIPTLAEKVDTCDIHQEQRAVLTSLGLAGKPCKNPEAKALLRKNARVVQLSRQSLAVGKMIAEAQRNAGVPDHLLKTLTRTMVTRWGNSYKQLLTNNGLRLAIDASVDKYKRENKGEKEAIIENDDAEGESKAGKPVPAAEIGLSEGDWEENIMLEAFLKYAFEIKQTIEHCTYCTGAQASQLLFDLKENFCHPEASLLVSAIPSSLSLADRVRTTEERTPADLCESVIKARGIMRDEIQKRLFDARPSNARLVQMRMSKQMSARVYLTKEQYELADTLYKCMLRGAVEIAGVDGGGESPAKKVKTEAATAPPKLFGAASNLPKAQQAQIDEAASEAGAATNQFDPVVVEIERWDYMAPEEIARFQDDTGLINEFKLLWHVRHRFPLHYVVFKQVSSHIPHEANVEQYFSRAGALSDPSLDPAYLGILTMVGVNSKRFKPSVAAVKERYYEKFRGKNVAQSDDEL